MPSLEQVRVHNQMADETEQTRLAREAQARAQITEADRLRTEQQAAIQQRAAEQQNVYQRAAAAQQAEFQNEAQQRQNQFTAGRDYTGALNQDVRDQTLHGLQTQRDTAQQQNTVFNDWNRENIARASSEQQHGHALDQQYRGAQYQQTRDAQGFLYQGALAEQHGEIQARLSQVQLGQQEEMRLQRLRQARSSVMANPNLSDAERHNLITQIDTGISPLENRQREAQTLNTNAQTAHAFQTATIQGQLFAQHQEWQARGAQRNLVTLEDPNNPGQRALFGVGPDGQLTRMDFTHTNDVHRMRIESHNSQMQTAQAQLEHLQQMIEANPNDTALRQQHAYLSNRMLGLQLQQSPDMFQANLRHLGATTANVGAHTEQIRQLMTHQAQLQPGTVEHQRVGNAIQALTYNQMPATHAAQLGLTNAHTEQVRAHVRDLNEIFRRGNLPVQQTLEAIEINGQTVVGQRDRHGEWRPLVHVQQPGVGGPGMGGGAGGAGGAGGVGRGGHVERDGVPANAELRATTLNRIMEDSDRLHSGPVYPAGHPNVGQAIPIGTPATEGLPSAGGHPRGETQAEADAREERRMAWVRNRHEHINNLLHPNATPNYGATPRASVATPENIRSAQQRAAIEVDQRIRGGALPANQREAEIERQTRTVLGAAGVLHPDQSAMAHEIGTEMARHPRAWNDALSRRNAWLDAVGEQFGIVPHPSASRAATVRHRILTNPGDWSTRTHENLRNFENELADHGGPTDAAEIIRGIFHGRPLSHLTQAERSALETAIASLPMATRNRVRQIMAGGGGGDW